MVVRVCVGEGLLFIEVLIYCYKGYLWSDLGAYWLEGELECWMECDLIALHECALVVGGVDQVCCDELREGAWMAVVEVFARVMSWLEPVFEL